jgi:hypothetical protein
MKKQRQVKKTTNKVGKQTTKGLLDPVKVSGAKQFGQDMQKWLNGRPTDESAKAAVKIVKAAFSIHPGLNTQSAANLKSTVLNRAFNSQIKLKVPISEGSLYGWAAGFISAVYRNGYQAYCAANQTPDNPFLAFNYILLQLVAAVQNKLTDNSSVSKIPVAYRDVIAALLPKVVSFPQGEIAYSWSIANIPTPLTMFNYPVGATANYPYRLFVPDDSLTAGYNNLSPPATPYTADLGAEAFNDVVSFIESSQLDKTYSGVTLVDKRWSDSDLFTSISAFNYVSSVIGEANDGGSMNTLVSSELPFISHPSFSVFTNGGASTATNVRAFNSHRPSGGDGNYLAYRQLVNARAKDNKNKNYPVFKFIDFYEIASRVAYMLVEAFQKYANDTTFKMEYTDIQMSSSDFLIMLWHQLMWFFVESQIGSQSVQPYRGATPNISMIPYTIDSGYTGSDTQALILVPKYLNMNLQALTARDVNPSINPRTKTVVSTNVRHYIPALSQYANATFNEKIYSYLGQSGTVSIFSGSADSIDLLSKTVNSTAVDLCNSPKIFQNIAKYNAVMTALSPYIQKLEKLSRESGTAIFTVIGQTHILKEVIENDKKKNKKDGKKKVEITLEEKKISAISSQYAVVNEVYEITGPFIRPEIMLYTPPGSGSSGTITDRTWRVYAHEAFLMSGGTPTQQQTELLNIVDVIPNWVAYCVKNRDASDDTAITMQEHFDKEGDGGLLDVIEMAAGTVVGSAVQMLPLAIRAASLV